MNQRILALALAGVMVVSMSTGAFAAKGGNDKGKPGTSKPPITEVKKPELTSGGSVYVPPVNNTSGGGVVLPMPGGTYEPKALQNQLAALNKQLQNELAKLKRATPKNKKAIENNIRTINQQIERTKEKIAEILKKSGLNDTDLQDKQKDYIKSIEDIVKKDRAKPIMVAVDKIVTDNAAIKAGLPLMVRNGVVYMAQSTLENSFGIQIKYVDEQNKFVTKIEGTLLEVFLTKDYIEVDGVPKKSAVKPYPINKDVYFPINMLDQYLKIEVKWDKANGIVTIDDLDIANPPVPAN